MNALPNKSFLQKLYRKINIYIRLKIKRFEEIKRKNDFFLNSVVFENIVKNGVGGKEMTKIELENCVPSPRLL